MTLPRLFLVAPNNAADLTGCIQAACKSGDCASILVPDTVTAETVAALQTLHLAVIIKDCEPRMVHHLKADGIQIARSAPVKNLRAMIKNESIGVFAATSRHIAMESAEAGADYIAFAQNSQKSGEPLLAWWHDLAEIPCVAFDPVAPEGLATLLPQKPDFIRPLDTMWQSPESAILTISELTRHLS